MAQAINIALATLLKTLSIRLVLCTLTKLARSLVLIGLATAVQAPYDRASKLKTEPETHTHSRA